MIKKILMVLLVALIVIQFIRPTKNISGEKSNDISTKYKMSDTVRLVFDKACSDCHSNKTKYPWYASVQPVAFWLNDHVMDGKRHFNLNDKGLNKIVSNIIYTFERLLKRFSCLHLARS